MRITKPTPLGVESEGARSLSVLLALEEHARKVRPEPAFAPPIRCSITTMSRLKPGHDDQWQRKHGSYSSRRQLLRKCTTLALLRLSAEHWMLPKPQLKRRSRREA
jgi:hypothetical protein